jgi:ADP-heptose:LPS heptosyltransferase
MRTLIIKLGASGDVVRTTTLLHVLKGEVDWLTSDANMELLEGIKGIRVFPWSRRSELRKNTYRLLINLEDTIEVSAEMRHIDYDELYGAHLTDDDSLSYTESARPWFDMGIISRFGIEEADRLKFQNRLSFQHLVFRGLGYDFGGEPYLLPRSASTSLAGDVAIAAVSGSTWPMKRWAFYDELAEMLRRDGLQVNFLPNRETMKEHLADVRNHRLLVSGDTLPMHLALGSNIRCVTIYICTSPWEIHDYGLQQKLVSGKLGDYFYSRYHDPASSTSVPLLDVYRAATQMLEETRWRKTATS